ncbi:PnuC protein [Scytonema tolypothrichoides VB-61278]|nr:PnuC protein [Scytonema tolypothrichoides VB-61278]
MITSSLFKYYALDWLAMAFSFVAVYLLGNQKRVGFVSFMVANFCWVVVGFMADSIAIAIGNIGFFCLNLRGFLRWSNAAKRSR